MKPLAIIPARGGSKRLPRKNVLEVGGRAMLAWPIEAARESGLFERVVVSTDDAAIAAAASEAGAQVHERAAALGADCATVAQVCTEWLEALRASGGPPDTFCCLYATALFVEPADLAASQALLDEPPAADFVMGVSTFSPHPVQALVESDGFLRSMWPEYAELQSQHYPDLVASNGTLYWARTAAFLEAGGFYGERLRGYLMPRERAVDIDTPADLALARRLLATAASGGD